MKNFFKRDVHPPYTPEWLNRVKVKMRSIDQQIVPIMVFSAPHCKLNKRGNAHYRHTAFIKNLMRQAASYFVTPSPQI